MKQAIVSGKTASPTHGDDQVANIDRSQAKQLFLMSSLSMSWQLALVVLLPLLGGYELDKALHTTPLLTLFGLVLASFGVVSVLKRQLAKFGPPPTKSKRSKL